MKAARELEVISPMPKVWNVPSNTDRPPNASSAVAAAVAMSQVGKRSNGDLLREGGDHEPSDDETDGQKKVLHLGHQIPHCTEATGGSGQQLFGQRESVSGNAFGAVIQCQPLIV